MGIPKHEYKVGDVYLVAHMGMNDDKYRILRCTRMPIKNERWKRVLSIFQFYRTSLMAHE